MALFLLFSLCVALVSCTAPEPQKTETDPDEEPQTDVPGEEKGREDAPLVEDGNLIYRSNGDGTCHVAGLVSNTNDDTFVTVAETSPAADKVTGIDKGAFVGSYLEEILLPKTLEHIGENAFSEVPVMAVYFAGNRPLWESITFDDGNDALLSADLYFYTENEPAAGGLFWHWVEGSLTVWEENADEYGELKPLH